jgi:hypothetical protein
MSIIATLLGLVPSVVSGVKEYVGKKQDLQQLRREAAIETEKAVLTAKIERAKSADIADTTLDKLSLENTGWKDEYLLAITTAPLVLTMSSPFLDLWFLTETYKDGMLANAVMEGFTSLSSAPEYYWWALGAVYIHALGMRRMLRIMIEKVGNFNLLSKGK